MCVGLPDGARHPEPSATSLCFSSKSGLHRKVYICLYCQFSSLYNTNLKVHVRTHSTERPFQCTSCNFRFNDLWFLQAHLLQHLLDQPYRCRWCDRDLTHNDRYTKSKRPELSEATKGLVESAFQPEGQLYACPFCSYSCLNRVNFECHVITHTGERPYRCSLCSKGFTQKHNLQYHMLIHRGLKPFVCGTCAQGFRRSYCLKLHKEKHGH